MFEVSFLQAIGSWFFFLVSALVYEVGPVVHVGFVLGGTDVCILVRGGEFIPL